MGKTQVRGYAFQTNEVEKSTEVASSIVKRSSSDTRAQERADRCDMQKHTSRKKIFQVPNNPPTNPTPHGNVTEQKHPQTNESQQKQEAASRTIQAL